MHIIHVPSPPRHQPTNPVRTPKFAQSTLHLPAAPALASYTPPRDAITASGNLRSNAWIADWKWGLAHGCIGMTCRDAIRALRYRGDGIGSFKWDFACSGCERWMEFHKRLSESRGIIFACECTNAESKKGGGGLRYIEWKWKSWVCKGKRKPPREKTERALPSFL
jgi:hypothetical protein